MPSFSPCCVTLWPNGLWLSNFETRLENEAAFPECHSQGTVSWVNSGMAWVNAFKWGASQPGDYSFNSANKCLWGLVPGASDSVSTNIKFPAISPVLLPLCPQVWVHSIPSVFLWLIRQRIATRRRASCGDCGVDD